MIRCYHCGTDNLDGSEYCDECGKKLSASSTTVSSSYIPPPPQLPSQMTAQNSPPPPPSFTRDAGTPKPATPYTPPPPPVRQPTSVAPSQPPQSPTTTFNGPTGSLKSGAEKAGGQSGSSSGESVVRAKLIIQRGGKIGKEFPIAGSESMIGRWDADGGIFPDIDLDQDDPEAKVSRRHARIQYLNNQYLIEDLGSTNGTFINRGPRLLPGNKQPLNNGDEIIVGKTFLKFILN
ncbi:MAG: FHA domain-containing protein [Acidobacteriota bacterium]|nr:MAG: FHA domain-containing protein [Acidobacteriota bacterium]